MALLSFWPSSANLLRTYRLYLAVIVIVIIAFWTSQPFLHSYAAQKLGQDWRQNSTAGLSSPSSEYQKTPQVPVVRPLKDFDPTTQIFDVPKNIVHNPAGPRPDQVILLTASDGKGHNGGIENITEMTTENRQKYCDYHGYINHFINISRYDLKGAHPTWGKLPAIIESFQTYPDAQWLWFLDLDAIIMTQNQSVIDLLLSHDGMRESLKFDTELHHAAGGLGLITPKKEATAFEDIDFLIAQDQNGFNAGSFFIRRSAFSQYMVDMWRDPLFLATPHMLEQDTLMHFAKNHPTFWQHTGLVRQNVINAYSVGGGEMGWTKGGLVMHFAGCWVGGNGRCQKLWTEFWNKKTDCTK